MSVDGVARCVSVTICAGLRGTAVAAGLLFPLMFHSTPGRAEAAYAFGQGEFGAWVAAYGNNYTTQSEAQAAAMQKCMGRGFTCSIIANFHKTCFAIAVRDGNNGWAVRYGSDLATASRSALQGCVSMGLACTIKDRFCDSVSEQEVQQAALDQANREFQDYLREWNECFAVTPTEVDAAAAIASCNQALAFARINVTDRDTLVRQRVVLQNRIQQMRGDAIRAAQQRRQDEAAAEAYTQYAAQEAACENYDEISCTVALRYPLAGGDSVARMRSALTTAQRFKADVTACKDGSVAACDIALASPATRDHDRAYLEQWRQATSPVERALAAVSSYWNAAWRGAESMPAGAKSAAIALTVLVLLTVTIWMRRRRSSRAPVPGAAAPPSNPAPLRREPRVDRPSPAPDIAAQAAARQNIDVTDIASSEPIVQEHAAQEPRRTHVSAQEGTKLDIAPATIMADRPIASPKLDKAAIKRALLARRQEFEL